MERYIEDILVELQIMGNRLNVIDAERSVVGDKVLGLRKALFYIDPGKFPLKKKKISKKLMVKESEVPV